MHTRKSGRPPTSPSSRTSAMAAPPTVPVCRPCLACGSHISTNRPLSYHLRKGVRKHLATGVCFRTDSGVQAVLPPLSSIAESSCMCLACVKIVDTILARLEKMPLRNGGAHSPIVRGPAPTITRARPAATSVALTRAVLRAGNNSVPRRTGASHATASLAAAVPAVSAALATSVAPTVAAPAAAEPNAVTSTAIATSTSKPPHPASALESVLKPAPNAASAPAPAPAPTPVAVPPIAPAAPAPEPEVEVPECMRSVPAGHCIVCYASSGGGSVGGDQYKAHVNGASTAPNAANGDTAKSSDDSTPPHTVSGLRDAVVGRVGEHLMTVESVVRIFRAARVELAEGVCGFDSRAFAGLLLRSKGEGCDGALCAPHHAALVQAAEVKAAGAVPCAICGEKPTLGGGEEVRTLAPVFIRLRRDDARIAVVCAVVLDIMRSRSAPVADERAFERSFAKFLEKEFACASCFAALLSKC